MAFWFEKSDVVTSDLTDKVVAAARLLGCDCAPEVTVGQVRPGVYSVRMSHDDWCRLLLARGLGNGSN